MGVAVLTKPFKPTSIPNLLGWWRSESLTGSDGATLTTWPDSSGQGHTMVSDTPYPRLALNAVNGRPAADFHPSAYSGLTYFIYDLGATNAQPNTVFSVIKFDDVATFAVAVGGEGMPPLGADWGTRRADVAVNSSTWWVNAGSWVDTGAAANTSWHVHTAIFNGASSKLRVDTREFSISPGTNSIESVTMGCQYDGDGRLDGRVAEHIVYDRLLSAAEIGKVEAYLQRKYNIPAAVVNATPTPSAWAATATHNAAGVDALPVTASLFAWYRGDSVTGADGAAVGSWPDDTGNGHTLTQATTANKPSIVYSALNGHKAVDFNPAVTNRFLQSASFTAETQPNTFFLVVKFDVSNATIVATDGIGGSNRNAIYTASSTYNLYAGATVTGAATSTNYRLITGLFNGASSKIRVDQVEATGNAGSNSITGILLGVQYDNSFPFDGRIAEFIMYNAALSGGDITSVENYLKTRYGI